MDPVEIIKKWKEITEVYDERKSNGRTLYMSDRELRELDEQIKLAMSLDESHVTTVMVIAKTLTDYLEDRTIPLAAVVKKVDQVMRFIGLYQELLEMLHAPDIEEMVVNFQKALRNSLVVTGFYNKKHQELIDSRYALAVLRLSALSANKTLRVDQFSKGENTTIGKLPFVNEIYEFYDINYMLSVAPRMPDGIYLSLFRDAVDDAHSFFGFTVKNGANLWLISDKPEFASPIQKHFPRSNPKEKAFSERVAARYFPYDLMSVKWDDDRARYVVQHDSYASALATVQDGWKTIGKISDLEADSALWVFMLFSLFQLKFFSEQPYLSAGISFSGMMLNLPANAANVAALVRADQGLVKYEPMTMAHLTMQNLTSDNPAIRAVWELSPTGKNQWAEDLYGPRVQDQLMDHLILPPGKKEIYLDRATNEIAPAPDMFAWAELRPSTLTVPGVELNTFGTQKELEQWIYWHARYLKTKAIQNLMWTEFEEKKDEVRKWYWERVKERMLALGEFIAKGEFFAEVSRRSPTRAFDSEMGQANILRLRHVDNYRSWASIAIADRLSSYYPYRWCYFNGAVASLVAEFDVCDGTSMAALLGIPLDELPPYLANIRENEIYTGNSRLSVGDPLEDMKNPWKDLNWRVGVFMSKSGYKTLCKKWGTNPQDIQKKE